MTTLHTILAKLINRESDLNTLLLQAQALLDDSNSSIIKDFISNELNGYQNPESLPSHRLIKASIQSKVVNHFGFTEIVPILVHEISEQIGQDLELIYMSDNISFIETNFAELKDDIVYRKFTPIQENLLQELVSKNNPGTQLLETYYLFPRVFVKQLIEGVRSRFIELLQSEVKNKSEVTDISNEGIKVIGRNGNIKVFVTYAWENDTHNGLVKSFTNFLRTQGYDASMDVKESQESTSINFSNMMIQGLIQADKVIVILSPKYCEKANENKDGVGFEFKMIINDMNDKTNKYIFASFGNYDRKEITPFSIKGTDVLDLKEDQDSDFNSLHAKLQSVNTIEFGDVGDELPKVKKEEIKPFKL